MKNNTPYAHPAWIEVDLAQFKKNILNIRKFIKNKKICVPIKANAYGHGLIPIAKAAEQAGADYLAVSCLQEGVLLRQAGIQHPILAFGPVYKDQVDDFVKYNLELTISSLAKAKLVSQALPKNHKIKVHVEIETGMQRTGVRTDSARQLFGFLDSDKRFIINGIYSHLATADQANNRFAQKQVASFTQFIKEINNRYPDAIIHLANSGGVLYYPESHFDMVRPGKLVFGYIDDQQKITQPIFSVKAKIAYFKVVQAGEGISYGHTYETKKNTRIITVPIGYGDGYRRVLSNRAEVLINNKRYPQVGTICMDQFMVDIGEDSAYVGDEVVLIGKQGDQEITLPELAEKSSTISSELLCGFNDRLPRYYHDQDTQFWEFDSLNSRLSH